MADDTHFIRKRCHQSRHQRFPWESEMRSKAMSFLSTLFHESELCKSLKSTQMDADMQSNGLQESSVVRLAGRGSGGKTPLWAMRLTSDGLAVR